MDYPYFRSAWRVVVASLLCAAFIPLIVIGGGMYYYAATVIQDKTLEGLRTEVVQHRKVVDRFLWERVRDLELLSETLGFDGLKRQDVLTETFLALQARLPAFIDLGVIDADGRHLAYVGPYDLLSKTYSDAPWFRALSDRRTYISDIFTGHRGAPHFIIAVKTEDSGTAWILRATVNTAYFHDLISETARNLGGEAFMVNREGRFQVCGPDRGQPLDPSELGEIDPFEGVRITAENGRLIAGVWQEAVPWMSVVSVERATVFKALHRVRFLGLMIFFITGIAIVATVLLTTDFLVSRLESSRRSLRFLDQQLRTCNRMAGAIQMSGGFFRDIRDGMANIDASAVLIRDRTSDGETRDTAEAIRSELGRIRKTMDRFTGLTAAREPVIGELNLNEVLDEQVELFDGELRHAKISIVREYGQIPPIRSDLYSLQQVFQNLLLNAVAAVGSDGVVTLSTESTSEGIRATVADNGPGIPSENVYRVFEPLFTTRPGASGLGLTVCEEALKKLGGTISVESAPGRGTAFTVALPFRMDSRRPGRS